jgi:ABC-type sugar transport system permease subunit
VRLIGLVVAILGVIFVVAGVATYIVVGTTLSDENITVSDDASYFAGDAVKGPFTAYVQADTIAKHAEEIAGGKTYAELPQDDPNRDAVMTASFLRASLFTSVVAFGVAALVAVLGLVLVALGWALRKIGAELTP